MGYIKHLFVICVVLSIALWTANDKFVSVTQAEPSGAEQLKPELVMQTGHTSAVSAAAFSPDDRWTASGSVDDTIKIWETSSGRELRVLDGHAGGVKSLAWSADGKSLVSGGNDKIVRLWNVETGSEIRVLSSFNQAAEVVVFSRNNLMIAAGSADGTIKILEFPSGREVKSLSDNGNRITALAFSPDGLLLAAGSSDNTVKVWEIGKDKKPRILKNHTDRVKTLDFSADGQFLASGGFDNTVRILKLSNGREVFKFTNHANAVLGLKFLSAEEIVSADANQRIKFWNPLTGSETRANAQISAAETVISAESAAFSADGNLAVFGRGDRTAAVFDAASGSETGSLKNHVVGFNSVIFSADNNWLAVGSADTTVKLWDLQTGQSLLPLAGHEGFVRSVVFHPDHQRIISASIDGTIRIWNIVSGESRTLGRHAGGVNSIAVSRAGNRLISASVDKTVKLWDLSTGRELRTLNGHGGEVTAVAFGADENLFASASVDKTVKIWNLNQMSEPQTLSGHTDAVAAVAFSPDGKLLVSAGADKNIKVWETASGNFIKNLTVEGKITTVSFSADGQKIASGGEDKTVRIWRVADGREETLSDAHSGAVKSVNFSVNGKWLASAGDDGSVNIWQTSAATDKLATLVSLNDNNDWLVVSPKGFFDGSPTAWNQLLWRFAGNTFNFSPVEVFFNEFYQPSLLADLLGGKRFDAKTDISIKDRRQPQLKISLADGRLPAGKISDRKVRLKIEIAENAAGGKKGSGARDVRLFRNGLLVKFWDGDVIGGKGKTTLEADVPIVDGQNQFTAYAFNDDNIKSSDQILSVSGAENLKRKGAVYILAIGVGKYANPDFNLSNIERDVKVFGEVLRLKQSEVNSGAAIKIFPLLDEQATKNNILQTLRAFAGEGGGQNNLPFAEPPEKIQPEDTLIVYFSGHGISHEKRFYMIPHDLGYAGKKADLEIGDNLNVLTKNSVSDAELEEVFRGVDAKNLLMIIDACESGQALETAENRQGPMNSKGLAQLAYEKGMYILTASQSDEEAIVSGSLKHSYLTYALVKDGLESAKADHNPADGNLFLREWFDYAEKRVPQIFREQTDKKNQAKGLDEVKVTNTNKEKIPAAAAETVKTQRPRIFYRRQTEQQPLLVARFPTAQK